MTAYEQLQDEVAYGWRNKHGRCGVYIYRPISPIGCIIKLLKLFYTVNIDKTTCIICNDVADSKELRKLVQDITVNNKIDVISGSYFKRPTDFNYDLIITVNIEDNIKLEQIIANKAVKFYLFIFDNKIIGDKKVIIRESLTSFINITIQPSKIIEEYIHLPVNDKHIPVYFIAENTLKYGEYTKYINESMRIFGSLEVMDRARLGDRIMNYSANHVCNVIASNNGWSFDIDTSTPFGKELDDTFNPNSLMERATNTYNIMKARKNFVGTAEEKLVKIANIVNDNIDKKILIVSINGEFANKITEYLNTNDKIICGNYHNCIEDKVQLKEDGTPVLIKTGSHKGEPKIIGWKKQSTLAMNDFNNDKINVLSIKATSDNDLNIKCDIVILTSPLATNIFEIKRRFNKVMFNSNPLELYTLFIVSSTENIKLDKLVESINYHILINDVNDNFRIDF